MINTRSFKVYLHFLKGTLLADPEEENEKKEEGMYSASRCLKVFNICEDLFTYSKNLLVVQVLIGNTLATTLSHMLKKLEIALCPEAGNGTVSTVPQVLTVF